MSALVLDVFAQAYELRLGGDVLARLQGGAAALLSGAREQLRELDMETAIELSEEWLMPHSKAFQGVDLRVRDATRRVRRCLGEQASFSPADVEEAFNLAFSAVAHARPIDRECVADIVLIRELVHHGRISRVLLD